MSRAVASMPLGDLVPTHHRMGRRRLFTAALVGVAALAVALAFALRPSPGPGVPGGPGVQQSLRGSLRVGKVSVSIPRGFHVYTQRGGVGYVLTNYRVPAGDVRDHWVDVLIGNGPPRNGVALQLNKDTLSGPFSAQLQLPLNLNQRWYRARPAELAASVQAGDFQLDNQAHRAQAYHVMYWIGPAAPANDRAAVLQALRSIRPTR